MSRSLNVARGDVDKDIKRTATGIHTVEGNVAGARAARLTKQREADASEFEARKLRVQQEIQRGTRKMDDRFSTASTEFKGQAVGLMSREEFARTSNLEDGPDDEASQAHKVHVDRGQRIVK